MVKKIKCGFDILFNILGVIFITSVFIIGLGALLIISLLLIGLILPLWQIGFLGKIFFILCLGVILPLSLGSLRCWISSGYEMVIDATNEVRNYIKEKDKK